MIKYMQPDPDHGETPPNMYSAYLGMQKFSTWWDNLRNHRAMFGTPSRILNEPDKFQHRR